MIDVYDSKKSTNREEELIDVKLREFCRVSQQINETQRLFTSTNVEFYPEIEHEPYCHFINAVYSSNGRLVAVMTKWGRVLV